MGFVQRKLVKFVIRVVSHPKLTLAICAGTLVASVVLALMGLSLSTDQDELLTPKLQFFREYKEFEGRFPENGSYQVMVEPLDFAKRPPAKRWTQFADRIGGSLMALTDDVKRVDVRVAPEQMGVQGLEFDQWDDVREESAHLGGMVQFATIVGDPNSAASIGLSLFNGGNLTRRTFAALGSGPPAESEPLALEMMRTLRGALTTIRKPGDWTHGIEIPSMANADPNASDDPEKRGYQMISDASKRKNSEAYKSERILIVTAYAPRDYSSLQDATEPLKRMRAAVDKVAVDFPEFKPPIITGRSALEADEMDTSSRDTRTAEILGLSLVFVVLLIFLRNLWLVIVAELCLGVGIGWTFGFATLAVGRLNLLSLVFVIALIGIGMDYLIQILTRYRFEKKRYDRPQAVWARVFRFVSPPISTACCGAAGAFLVAMLTNFRGAAELGLIAGGGLLLCLVAGYTVVPALLTLFPASVGKVTESRRYRHKDRLPGAGGWRLAPAVLWVLIAGAGLFIALPPQFDPNLLKLQASELPSVREVRKLGTWNAVVTSEDLAKLRAAREAFTPKQGEHTTIDHTESILDAYDKHDWLNEQNASKIKVNWHEPAPPTEGDLAGIADDAKALVDKWSGQKDAGDLSALRTAVTDLRAAITTGTLPVAERIGLVAEWQKRFVEEVRINTNQFAPPPVDENILPPQLHDHLMSDHLPDGSAAKRLYALYIYPREDLWDSAKLSQFVAEVEARMKDHRAATGTDAILTGIAPQLVHSTEEIHKAFMNSTIYALILIFVLVFLDMGKLSQTLLAVSVLALGLPMLLLMMHIWQYWLDEPWGIPGSWNFANFFALPILIGAGHEYGVFLVHRYKETLHDPRRVWRPWDVSDRALLLCGIVTSASFGFLVGAKHHGLQSLGWVMAVGTACIYLAGILVLRPILTWRLKHKGVYHSIETGQATEVVDAEAL